MKIKLCVNLLLAVLIGLTSCNKKQDNPNIIFILSDDHGAQAISCYDSTLINTPNIDRIASNGAIFKNSFVTNSICAPSRAAILTGKYGNANGVMNNRTPFDTSQITFPKLLKQKGYQTALVGKWHLKTKPSGFDYSCILPGQGDYLDPEFILDKDTVKFNGYVTDIITDIGLKWLNNRKKDSPFCLLIHHKATHTPNIPPEKYINLFQEKEIPLPATFYDDLSSRSTAVKNQNITLRRGFPKHYRSLPDSIDQQSEKYARYQMVMEDYLGCVKSLDDNIGRVLDYLEEDKLKENTIVIYASDQGFFLGEHGWFNKRFMYEESMKMPLVMQYPAKINSGTVVNEMVLNIDLAPTILDFSLLEIPNSMQGRSMRNLLSNNTPVQNWRHSVYYHYDEWNGFKVPSHFGIRTDQYKLIHYYDFDEWELYDLNKDPNELNNVINNPDHQKLVDSLKLKIKEERLFYGDTLSPAI